MKDKLLYLDAHRSPDNRIKTLIRRALGDIARLTSKRDRSP
jgi:hypothetical protein